MTRPDGSPGIPRFSSARLDRLARLLEGYVHRGDMAGIAVRVGRGDETVYDARVGLADIESGRRLAGDTIFRIASMTKPVTAVAMMMLYEEGLFDLNTPVAHLVPAFRDLQVCVGERADGGPKLVPVSRTLTLRHLFTHSGGLSYGGEKDPVDRAYREAFEPFQQGKRTMTLAAMLEGITRLPLAFQPGTGYRYSMGVDVLGALVEVLSGVPFDKFLEERVLGPLGMVDTAFHVPPGKAARVATLYGRSADRKSLRPLTDDRPPAQPPSYPSPGGGLVSTVNDYARFCRMFLNGGALDGERLLSPTTVAMFSMNHMPEAALVDMHARDGETAGFGCSLGSRVLMDVSATGRYGSVGEHGWEGAYTTYFWVDPKMSLYGILMSQYEPIHFPIFRRFKQLTYQAMV